MRQDNPELPIVMISGHGNIETAVSAIKRGAYDFIEKPFKADRLLLVAERALENSRLKREVRELKQTRAARRRAGRPLAGRQRAAADHRKGRADQQPHPRSSAPRAAGKELAARTIHALSSRANAPFVVINAAAITPDRMEVELFGVEGGNGSGSRKVGALEEAHGGTLFIDEIADMPRETQNKIMRVLVDQTFQRVGGTTKVIGRRAHRVLDRPQYRSPTSPPANSARTFITGCRWCRSACRRSPSGARTFPSWSNIS